MKRCILYDGEVGDKSLDLVIIDKIEEAKELGEPVFLRWNGFTMRITGDTKQYEVLKDYREQVRARVLFEMEGVGELVTLDLLAERIANLLKKHFI